MKRLYSLISAIDLIDSFGPKDIEVSGLALDSRMVQSDNLFAATRGANTDGHLFIEKAIDLGATVILCEEVVDPKDHVTYLVVENSAKALGLIASVFYGSPSNKLKLIGVTGTNGKTSVATMLYECFRKLDHNCGLLSTIKYSINGIDAMLAVVR